MKEEEELEMLLGEISHATSSSLHHHHHLQNHSSHVDHPYIHGGGGGGHASCVADQRNNRRGWCDGNNNTTTIHPLMYDDDCFSHHHHHKYAAASSPVSGFSLHSDGSSSSLFSSGGGGGSPPSPQFENFKPPPPHFPHNNGFSLDFNNNAAAATDFSDYFDLSRNFSKMHIAATEQRGVPISPYGIHHEAPENYRNRYPDFGVLNNNASVPRKPIPNLESVRFLPNQPEFETPALTSSRFYGDDIMGLSSLINNPSISSDSLFYPPRNGLLTLPTRYNDENFIHYERNKAPLSVENEDSFIVHGESIDHRFRGRNSNTNSNTLSGKNRANHVGPAVPTMNISDSKFSSLAAARGNIYHIAKDQHGCRFLQRVFEEGTLLDVYIIFVEIIGHAVELMMNPFGNYLMQKLLDVCSEGQRMHVLFMATNDLVRISLNTHGTRVVQKLIETVKTKQQISLIIAALEPGFLELVKDMNGNHVIKRCLQCFPHEDRKFIFVDAAKYCVEMATHQYGCCVLQRCISHSTGAHLQNLVSEISANALLLAQDAYGNYAVQYLLELKIPSAISKITSQFEGNYVHLSTQKFSSHVVEMCLTVCNEEMRSKIIRELLSASYFDQLLQDPHANYVVQKALRFSQGRLHNCLVHAIESYKVMSRNSPYSKRFYSHKLLKR
ncbi:hypothetical protein ABFS83_14G095700 [Erythranthe nasuta]